MQMTTKAIIPVDETMDLTALTPAQRLFLFYYAQCPDLEWAAEQAGVSPTTVRYTWSKNALFKAWWDRVVRTEVTDLIKSKAKEEAARSLARLIELRDQDKNMRVSLAASKLLLQAMADPTFQNKMEITRDVGANWMRVFKTISPALEGVAKGEIVEAADWQLLEDKGVSEMSQVHDENDVPDVQEED